MMCLVQYACCTAIIAGRHTAVVLSLVTIVSGIDVHAAQPLLCVPRLMVLPNATIRGCSRSFS